ncbi:organic solvent tolerance protein [Phycisphaerae bacterium RAS1]|nr:organic solvent tolerance protein [Phycisphaerae bacterium RAS1]
MICVPLWLRRITFTAALICLGGAASAPAQVVDDEDQPLLPALIADYPVEMRSQYARQWRHDDGALVLVLTGDFEMRAGRRRMTSANGVVWIYPKSDEAGRRYSELAVYLSENAEVEEPGGTVTIDNVLLVSNLRTYGKLIKYHDAHADASAESGAFYQQALRDRALIEAGAPDETAGEGGVASPEAVKRPRQDRRPRSVWVSIENLESAQTTLGELVYVATGGVYLSQAGGANQPFMEIRADNAVIFPVAGGAADLVGREAGKGPATAPSRPEDDAPATQPSGTARGDERGGGLTRQVQQSVRAVYLEGDVVLSMGTQFVRASRLYYDFERQRAVMLDAVYRADVPERQIPLYVRADQIRQLSEREFAADHASVTTSEFYTPHYHIGAERVYIRDLTQRDAAGRSTSPVSGQYEIHNSTLNIGGAPLLWWPYSKGTLEQSETLLRRFSSGYSDTFGFTVETGWHLFNLLGIQAPPGYDATLRLDYYENRGPAGGINLDYQREDHYGLFRSYYVNDRGRDERLGPLRRNEWEPSDDNRGRVLWRHRHYLPEDWEATLELAYISDPNFLETYERQEFNAGKEQETVFFLKRARDTEAITLLANWRLLDFVTQTEHLPDIVYRRIGDTFGSPFALYHESRLGNVRYRPDDRRFFDEGYFDNTGQTGNTFRGDIREEVEAPLKSGIANIVPFATVRGSYWEHTPFGDGAEFRGYGGYGVRGSTVFSRVFHDAESALFDIHGIRHIIKPDFVIWHAASNMNAAEITPFDYGIETIEDFYGGSIGLRQTWQTKRGTGDKRRTVDLLTFDLEAGVFGDAKPGDVSNGYVTAFRPENSRARNYIAGDLIYRLSDTTNFLYEFNYDMNDRSLDRHNVSIAVERNPRLSYVFGSRYAGDIDMNLVGGGYNYKLNEKHITAFRMWYDIDGGDLGEFAVSYIRKLPRWYVGMTFEYSNIDDDFSVNFSVWPEGIPEWTLGSRRFVGLSNSTGIRP